MPLILTEEQTMLKEAADGFLNEHAPIAHLRKLRDSKDPDGVSRDLWRAFGEMVCGKMTSFLMRARRKFS